MAIFFPPVAFLHHYFPKCVSAFLLLSFDLIDSNPTLRKGGTLLFRNLPGLFCLGLKPDLVTRNTSPKGRQAHCSPWAQNLDKNLHSGLVLDSLKNKEHLFLTHTEKRALWPRNSLAMGTLLSQRGGGVKQPLFPMGRQEPLSGLEINKNLPLLTSNQISWNKEPLSPSMEMRLFPLLGR